MPSSRIENRTIVLCLLSALMMQGQPIWADEMPAQAESLSDALVNGKPLLDFRLRYEHDEEDGKSKNADAFTLRGIVGWQTQTFNNFSATVQAIGVGRLIDEYDDLKHGKNEPGRSNYPVVVDPDYFNLFQMFVDWTGVPDTRLRLGRQAVTLDDGRFVGTSGLRQVMRTFDGVSIENKSLPDTEFYFAHFEHFVNPPAKWISADVDIAHVTYKFTPSESIGAYVYLFDHATSDSSKTLGLRLDGARPVNENWKALYTAEYAKQDDYKDGSSNIDAHFTHLGVGAAWGDWSVRLDREAFSSHQGLYAFQTPMGNSHQGATDLFGGIPSDGLIDTALTVGGKVLDVGVSAGYHRIDADRNFASTGGRTGDRYGQEYDVGLLYAFSERISGGLDYAYFREGDVRATGAFPDIRKVWLTLLYQY